MWSVFGTHTRSPDEDGHCVLLKVSSLEIIQYTTILYSGSAQYPSTKALFKRMTNKLWRTLTCWRTALRNVLGLKRLLRSTGLSNKSPLATAATHRESDAFFRAMAVSHACGVSGPSHKRDLFGVRDRPGDDIGRQRQKHERGLRPDPSVPNVRELVALEPRF